MSTLGLMLADVIVAVLALMMAVRGAYAGFVSTLFSMVGFALGAYTGYRLGETLVRAEPDFAAYASIVVVACAAISAVAGRLLSAAIGGRIASPLRRVRFLRVFDGGGGAVLGASVGLLFAWALGVFFLEGPLQPFLNQQSRESVERSAILGAMNERLPHAALLDGASGVMAGVDNRPATFRSTPSTGASGSETGLEPAVQRDVERATRSVVRVVGASGYWYGSSGSGWVAGPELVVTNAHVIEDSEYLAVSPEGSWRRLEAEPVSVDRRNDVAILRVPGLELPALSLAEPVEGEPVTILGYPYGGPLDAETGHLDATWPIMTRDAYEEGVVRRYVTSIQGEANPGNSGGPVVNRRGEVVATVFGSNISPGYGESPDYSPGSYGEETAYGIPSSIVQGRLESAQSRRSRHRDRRRRDRRGRTGGRDFWRRPLRAKGLSVRREAGANAGQGWATDRGWRHPG